MLRPLLASEPGDVSELVLQAFMRGLHHAAPGRTYSAPAAIFVWYRAEIPELFARFEGDFGGFFRRSLRARRRLARWRRAG